MLLFVWCAARYVVCRVIVVKIPITKRESVTCIHGSECFGCSVLSCKMLIILRCGGMIGVFFLVKRCSLLYLYAGNGAFLPPPYLDIHGEIDVSMRCVLGVGWYDRASLLMCLADGAVDSSYTRRVGKRYARCGLTMAYPPLLRGNWKAQ